MDDPTAPASPPDRPPAPEPGGVLAARLRGFGPLGVIVTLIILASGPIVEPLGGLLVLGWARLSRTPWRALGLQRPASWPRTIVVGILVGVALKFFMKSVVMPLLGAPPMNPAYQFLAGNTAVLPGFVFDLIVGAGFTEEAVFRGFAFERSRAAFGGGTWARALTVLITSIWFGAVHYPGQGLPGAEQALITGLVFGTWFAIHGNLWPMMVGHAAFDLTAVWMIYNGYETKIAQFFFK